MSGLVEDKDAILGSLDSVSALANETSDLAVGIRPAFVRDVKGLRKVATNLNQGRSEIDRALQIMPIKLDQDRAHRHQRLVLQLLPVPVPGQRPRRRPARSRSSTTPAPSARTRGATSDEHAIPRTQPGPDRGDQHRRAHRPAGPGLQRQQPAAHRWRRHLPRCLRRVRRSQARRRGPHRRRPRRQGRRRRAQGRPRRGVASRSRPPRSSAPRRWQRSRSRPCWARCSSPSSRPAPASSRRTPRSRCPGRRSPYNVVQAFSGLADRAEKIDVDRLGEVDRHPGRR